MNRPSKTQNGIISVVERMKATAGVTSVAALSQYLGYRSNAIQNTVSRGHVPYKEAAILALDKRVSLDYLILGRERAAAAERAADLPYVRATRDPRLSVERDDDAAWREQNRRAQDVLREVVTGVESALVDAGLVMMPAKKAELVATLFEIYAEAHARPSRDHILRLVRNAS